MKYLKKLPVVVLVLIVCAVCLLCEYLKANASLPHIVEYLISVFVGPIFVLSIIFIVFSWLSIMAWFIFIVAGGESRPTFESFFQIWCFRPISFGKDKSTKTKRDV